jgi:hypothetical protein
MAKGEMEITSNIRIETDARVTILVFILVSSI